MKIFRTVIVATLMMAFLGLTNLACNTTEGAGKDVENLGKDIKHSAQDNK